MRNLASHYSCLFFILLFFIFCFLFFNKKHLNIVQISMPGSFQLLHCQTWGRDSLVSLPSLGLWRLRFRSICYIKLLNSGLSMFLHLDRFGTLSPGCEHKALDFSVSLGKQECSGRPIPEWRKQEKWGKCYCSYFDVLTPSARLEAELHSFFKNFCIAPSAMCGTILGAGICLFHNCILRNIKWWTENLFKK